MPHPDSTTPDIEVMVLDCLKFFQEIEDDTGWLPPAIIYYNKSMDQYFLWGRCPLTAGMELQSIFNDEFEADMALSDYNDNWPHEKTMH